MESNDPRRTAERLLLYKKNQLSLEEKEQFEQQLADNPLLMDLLEELDDKTLTNENVALMGSFDTEAALAKHYRQIQFNKPVNRNIRPGTFLWIAAALVFILITVTVFKTYVSKDQSPSQLAEQGNSEVKLRLATGEELSLDSLFSAEKDQLLIENKEGELQLANQSAGNTRVAVKMNTLIVPFQRTYKMVLHDGTVVHLNSGSTLEFPTSFSGGERRVKLNGEGYFEVAPDANKKFIVEVAGLRVEVLGTIFNVKSYEDDDQIYATLVKGRIMIPRSGGENEVLKPGEQAVYNKTTKVLTSSAVYVEPSIAWKNGLLYFKDHTLKEIMQQLSRWYDLEIEFEEKGIDTIRFNGKMKMYDSVEDVLRKFEKVGDVSFNIQGNHVRVKKQKVK